jgi:Protein of unknown function (DUF3014)
MDEWSVHEDRPNLRPAGRSSAWIVPALVIAVIGGSAAGYIWWTLRGPQFGPGSEPPPAAQASAEPAPAPAPAAPPEPRHPLPAAEPQAKARALPTLDMSDSMARESLAELFSREGFAQLFLPVNLVRRIVATIDNLPREAAPRRMMPVKPVPGAFAVAGQGEAAVLDRANFARYAPYVRALASVDARVLVAAYVHAYPLFQRAYRELGYPQGHFNDRLIEAIDDMLAAPEIDAPIKLLRPKVLYEFADPDLETRSAGQKILLRMGAANAVQVKAKLRAIRREIIAASEPRQ